MKKEKVNKIVKIVTRSTCGIREQDRSIIDCVCSLSMHVQYSTVVHYKALQIQYKVA